MTTIARRTIAGLLGAAALAAMPIAPASATRVVPGAELLDYCHNVKGFQSVYDVTGFRPKWLLDFSTPARRWDCVRNPYWTAR